MKKFITFIISCWVVLMIASVGFGANKKLAQTGMKFLSVTTDARAGAMGEASVAVTGYNSASMFFNPSVMAMMQDAYSVSLGRIAWIADINYLYASSAMMPFNGRYGVFGASLIAVDYGTFVGTIRDDDPNNEAGFIETGNFSPGAMAIGIGYAKALSSKFAIGGNIKYVFQDLGKSIIGYDDTDNYIRQSYKEDVFAFDFGIFYRTGFESLNFGMCIRNFSSEVTYEEEGFQLPLTFEIGVAMNILDIYPFLAPESNVVLLSVDTVHPRDYPEQINFGTEYLFMNTFAVRLGYAFPNDEHGFSAGLGLQQSLRRYKIAVDYSYTPFGVFDDVHRFSLQLSM